METLFNIKKTYTESPSKTKIEEKALTLEKAQFELDINENLWRKNGGYIVNRDEFSLTVEESDGSETITWTIEECDE